MKLSKTYATYAVIAFAYIASRFGVAIDSKDPQLVQLVVDAMAFAATAYGLVKRYQSGGINAFGVRKPEPPKLDAKAAVKPKSKRV